MKICGFFNNSKKNKANLFRNIFANCVIGFVLIGLFALTYAGGILNVAGSSEVEAIYQGNTESKNICLMINVYWGNEYIPKMLETLEENNVKTTFFIGGSWAEDFPEILKEIYNGGHEIANHAYSHPDLKEKSLEINKTEISKTTDIIKQLLNVEMTLFAPPSGSYSETTLQVAKELGYTTIMWTRDTIDWRDQDSELIYSRAVKNAAGGDLILMHPTKETANALPNIIKTLKDQGFNLTTVSETIA